MQRNLPLVVLGLLVIGAIQVACNYWLRPHPVVAERVERLHLDVKAGVIYASLAGHDGAVTIAMTPRAAVQLQMEIGHLASETERRVKPSTPQL